MFKLCLWSANGCEWNNMLDGQVACNLFFELRNIKPSKALVWFPSTEMENE